MTEMVSCRTGRTRAPPFMTTFSPPKPVRTKAVSLEARLYSRAKISPRINRATSPTPEMMAISMIEFI
ncbi:hypothetical protein D3C87_1756860 [compost metagenome]